MITESSGAVIKAGWGCVSRTVHYCAGHNQCSRGKQKQNGSGPSYLSWNSNVSPFLTPGFINGKCEAELGQRWVELDRSQVQDVAKFSLPCTTRSMHLLSQALLAEGWIPGALPAWNILWFTGVQAWKGSQFFKIPIWLYCSLLKID